VQARAVFTLGRLHQKRFDELQFKEAATVEEVLGNKIQLLQTIEQLYVQAIGFGQGEWAIAALQEAARLYKGFASFIETAPIPAELSPQDRASYQGQLQQQAQGYVAKAQETITACAEKAEQLKVFTAHAQACAQGGLEPVVPLGTRQRSAAAADDEAYQKELVQLRNELARTPESADLLKKLARRALQQGDLHLAKVTLSKVVEQNVRDGAAQNLLGVTLWSLGMPQEGFMALERAHKERNPTAAANLAALYHTYGYTRLVARYLSEAGTLSGVDLSSPDFHPAVRQVAGGGT
jgi:Flp pilus assembly protein TadD